jgi:N-methylhydantoinase A
MQSVGVDVGGTFTDIASVGSDGRLVILKVLSTSGDYSEAICAGVEQMVRAGDVSPGDVRHLVHAATIATNTVITATGARVGLITTEGFRDVLEIGRLRYPRLYDMEWEKPPPLVPRHLRREVVERIDFRGQVVTALDQDSVAAAVDRLLAADVESIAICLINAYANPEHEQRIAEYIRANAPHLDLSISSEVLPEVKEFERTSTTVLNAYIKPVVAQYLSNLEERLARMGFEAPITVMQSSGGTVRTGVARERPVYSIESGPAAGVVGAAALGKHLGMPNLISFDMGGTTAKTCLIEHGVPRLTSEYEVGGGLNIGHRLLRGGGYLLRVPAIDLAEIGAGGGSISWIDRGGALRVGPQSAGATPGPACYQRGGTLPTVTDANVALGYLNPRYLVGGELEIDADLARRALHDEIAGPLGMSLEQAAFGIHTIVNATMVRAVRAVSSEIGRDPNEFVLFAFGGSGPVHSATLAREAEIPHVIVPPAPGVFSAVGLLVSTVEHQYVQTFWHDLAGADIDALRGHFERLDAEARETLRGEGFDEGQITVQRLVDLRYPGQTSEITIELPHGQITPAVVAPLVEAFHVEHENTYGHRSEEGEQVEIVNVRLRARGLSDDDFTPGDLAAAGARRGRGRGTGVTSRPAWFGESYGWVETPVVERADLDAAPRAGPLIVEEYDATVVAPPDSSVFVDDANNIRIDIDLGRGGSTR